MSLSLSPFNSTFIFLNLVSDINTIRSVDFESELLAVDPSGGLKRFVQHLVKLSGATVPEQNRSLRENGNDYLVEIGYPAGLNARNQSKNFYPNSI